MNNGKNFSALPAWAATGLALMRMLTGLLMAYHGLEVFKPDVIRSYTDWEAIKALPSPLIMVYLGKGLELVTGICLVLGLYTRIAAIFMCINMLFICFRVGGGKFWYEDQHPFIFALLALVFFFAGPVKFGLDNYLFTKRKTYY